VADALRDTQHGMFEPHNHRASDVFSSIKNLNPPQNQNLQEMFSTRAVRKPHFFLDTSRRRTLAYGHWCNWGNVLESIKICSHPRFAEESVSAACATTLRRISPSLKRFGSANETRWQARISFRCRLKKPLR
jgi:hypothetical protein